MENIYPLNSKSIDIQVNIEKKIPEELLRVSAPGEAGELFYQALKERKKLKLRIRKRTKRRK